MPSHYSNLLQLIGFDTGSISGLFSDFKDPKPLWAKLLEPEFKGAQEALGGLPGLRRGLLGQLTGGLQQRSVAAGSGLEGRRAQSGFAGSGQIDQLGQLGRRGLQQEFGRGSFRIDQDIQEREAGILGGLSGKVSSFLEALTASGTELADRSAKPLSFDAWMDENYPNLHPELRFQKREEYESYLSSLDDTTGQTTLPDEDEGDGPGGVSTQLGQFERNIGGGRGPGF